MAAAQPSHPCTVMMAHACQSTWHLHATLMSPRASIRCIHAHAYDHAHAHAHDHVRATGRQSSTKSWGASMIPAVIQSHR